MLLRCTDFALTWNQVPLAHKLPLRKYLPGLEWRTHGLALDSGDDVLRDEVAVATDDGSFGASAC